MPTGSDDVRSWGDCVAKVENRTTLKISRKLIFRLLCCCVAIQRRYEGPWSILDKSIWSLTSPRSIRISSSKKFRSSPQKEFFNTIPLRTDIVTVRRQVSKVPKTEVASLIARRRPARSTFAASHKKGRGPLNQPKGRHRADRVRRDHVEPIDCPLKQGRFEAKRHCGAEQAARR